MSKYLGAFSIGLAVLGYALIWLSQQEPYTRADGGLAIVGFGALLVGASAFGWVIV